MKGSHWVATQVFCWFKVVWKASSPVLHIVCHHRRADDAVCVDALCVMGEKTACTATTLLLALTLLTYLKVLPKCLLRRAERFRAILITGASSNVSLEEKYLLCALHLILSQRKGCMLFRVTKNDRSRWDGSRDLRGSSQRRRRSRSRRSRRRHQCTRRSKIRRGRWNRVLRRSKQRRRRRSR